jgi:hypothetical protein
MAISDFYASTVVEVRAHFGFARFDCDPDEITRFLGVQPDELGRTGATKLVRSGREIRWPFNSWSLRSTIESKDVNEHVRELLGRLSGVVKDLPAAFGGPTFSVIWKGNYLYAGSGPFYESDVIAGIARIGASLYQDIYQVDDASDEVTGGN